MGRQRFLMISSWRVLLITLLALPAFAGSATLTGTLIAPNGRAFNGKLRVQLAYPAKQVSTGKYVTIEPITYRLVAGVIYYGATVGGTAPALVANDDMDPSNDFYWFDLADQYGNVVSRAKYVVTGSTFDIGLAVPTPLTTLNISFQDLLGLRNVSGDNFTIAKSLFGNGGGFKHKRLSSCGTAAGANSVCTTSVTWDTSFINASYTVGCTLSNSPVVGSSVTRIVGVPTAAGIVVEITNGAAGGAAGGNLNCIAVHD